MTTVVHDAYTRFRRAERMFRNREYAAAAKQLELVVASDDIGHGLHEARTLLARSYFHSAQLGRAETVARALVEERPDDAYAVLLLGRTLQRMSRPDEAAPHLALAAAYGMETSRH